MPGSFLIFERHCGFWNYMSICCSYLRGCHTFFSIFLFLRCFAADFFWILFRNRTGTRFDIGSIPMSTSLKNACYLEYLLPTFIVASDSC